MIDVVEALPGTRAGNYIAGQLIKSCHSSTFNYGEAQAAESREDFIHKLGVVLKELRWFKKIQFCHSLAKGNPLFSRTYGFPLSWE